MSQDLRPSHSDNQPETPDSAVSQPVVKKRRWLRITLFTIFAIVLIVLALPIALLNSTWALTYATNQINQLDTLSVKYEQGTLFDTMVFTNISLALPGWSIALDRIETGLTLACLWEQSLCVSTLMTKGLSVEQLSLTQTADETPPASEPAGLPFPVVVERIVFNDIKIRLLDGTEIHTSIAISDITLSPNANSDILLDVADVNIDINELNVLLPAITASALPATPIAATSKQAANTSTQPSNNTTTSSSSLSLSEQLRKAHDAAIEVPTQYAQVIAQWQSLSAAPQAWLASQTPLAIPIYAPDMVISAPNINISDVSKQINIQAISAHISASIAPSAITQSVNIEHTAFTLTQSLRLASNWEHEVEIWLQWQAMNIEQADIALETQGGELALSGNIAQWQLASQGNMDTLHVGDMQLSALQWQLALNGNSQADEQRSDPTKLAGITIAPSVIALAPHQVSLSGTIPNIPDKPVAINIRHTAPHMTNQLKIVDVLSSPHITLTSRLSELRQGMVVIEEAQLDLTGSFSGLDAQLSATIITPDTLIKTSEQALPEVFTGQITQQSQLRVTDTGFETTIKNMAFTSSLGKITLAPYRLAVSPEKIMLSQWQLNATNTQAESLGDLIIAPIQTAVVDSLAAAITQDTSLEFDVSLASLNVQGIIDMVNPMLSEPVAVQSDALLNGSVRLALAGSAEKPHLALTSQLSMSPSLWQLTPKLDAQVNEANLNATGQYALFPTPTPLILTSDGVIQGERLGAINYQLDMAQDITLYTQINDINLGLVAPFLPQFETFTGRTSANIALKKTDEKLSLNGILIIPELEIEIDQIDKNAQTLHNDIVITLPVEQGFNQSTDVFAEAPLALDANIRVLVDPLEKDAVSIAGFDFSTHLQGSVEFSLNQQQPSVIGSIALNNGQYQAYGQDLLIRNGQLIFNGPVSLPYIQLEAIRNPKNMNDDVIAGLQVSGLANQLNARLFSEPMLENPNILSYIIRGKDLNEDTQEDNSVVLTNALLGFGLGKTQDGIRSFGDTIGVDNLQLSTQGQGTNTQLGITGQLNDRLSVEYRVGVFNAIAEFGLRYQWMPDLYVEATSGAENALDVFYQLSWGERDIETSLPLTEQSMIKD